VDANCGWTLKQTVRMMLEGADRVVAQSSDTRNNSRIYYGVDRHIDIIPLGIRQNPYPVKTRRELDLPDAGWVFVTIGRIVRRKNIPELLEVFAEVRKEIPCMLLVIGDGPEMGTLGRKIQEMNIGESVRMTGRVDDERKFQYLCAADLYLSTALHEGFGIVFLEAMECGLPIVCYDRGGQTDFLKEGETGSLVRLGDREGFKNQTIDLMISDQKRRRIREHNREYVKEFYIGRCADRYLEIFDAVLSRKGGNVAI
jgi:glycosyltransferase involved in cell wall biosynthesis